MLTQRLHCCGCARLLLAVVVHGCVCLWWCRRAAPGACTLSEVHGLGATCSSSVQRRLLYHTAAVHSSHVQHGVYRVVPHGCSTGCSCSNCGPQAAAAAAAAACVLLSIVCQIGMLYLLVVHLWSCGALVIRLLLCFVFLLFVLCQHGSASLQ